MRVVIYLQHRCIPKAKELFPHIFYKDIEEELTADNSYHVYRFPIPGLSKEDELALKLTFNNTELNIYSGDPYHVRKKLIL